MLIKENGLHNDPTVRATWHIGHEIVQAEFQKCLGNASFRKVEFFAATVNVLQGTYHLRNN